MRSVDRRLALAAPAAFAAIVVFAWANAHAGEGETVRHREFDGTGARLADLDAVARVHREAGGSLQKAVSSLPSVAVRLPEDAGHHAGMKACFSVRERRLSLSTALPGAVRGRTIYVVTAPGGDAVPKVLAGSLSDDALILVVEARSMGDVAALAKAVGRPVSFASAELARALGAECRDARIVVSRDGRSVEILEGWP